MTADATAPVELGLRLVFARAPRRAAPRADGGRRRPAVDRPSDAVRTLAERLTAGAGTRRERALACFRFVRDEIRFGFTPRFDHATPDETVRLGRGHCNPQATLFASLLHAADVDARLHFVTIGNEILHGIFPGPGRPPDRLLHAFTEVALDGGWMRVDGYIVDPPLHTAAVLRLRASGRRLGLGVHVDGRIDWDGQGDCMAQFVDPAMRIGPDHGTSLDPTRLYASAANPQRLGVVGGFFFRRFAVGPANATLEEVRERA